MKFVIIFAALFAVAFAAPAQLGNVAEIIQQESDVRPDGFEYKFATSDGTAAQEQGQLKQIGEEAAVVVSGSYQFVADDGQTYTITYVADENGYQPQGAHLPVAPVA